MANRFGAVGVRRPHRWQVRRRQEWMTEYGELCRERERIVHIARFYGVPG